MMRQSNARVATSAGSVKSHIMALKVNSAIPAPPGEMGNNINIQMANMRLNITGKSAKVGSKNA